MAEIYKSVGGRKLEKAIAITEEVQNELEAILFEMQARASVDLVEHRHDGHAQIEIDHGDVDWYLTLSDERGQKAALSIEFGRQAYVDPETGEEKGAMEGLYILHKATNLPRKRKGKVKK